MEFDDEHKCKWHLINKREARVFVDFLLDERDRHEKEVCFAKEKLVLTKFKPVAKDKGQTWVELYESAIKRHEEDIRDIDQLIRQVKHWHQI